MGVLHKFSLLAWALIQNPEKINGTWVFQIEQISPLANNSKQVYGAAGEGGQKKNLEEALTVPWQPNTKVIMVNAIRVLSQF